MKVNIKNLSLREIGAAVDQLGEKRHRKTQLLQWLYQKGASSFLEMTNLSLPLRNRLDELYYIPSLHPARSVTSREDKSQKFLFTLEDGFSIESVLMEARGNYTVCVSSQVGCPLECSFCCTGAGGFERNLQSGEILGQVLYMKMNHIPPRRRYNIVFMGMGDPLLNMDNLEKALEILNEEAAFALGEKRITVSTIGFPAGIAELASSPLKFGLAVSLNATTDDVRKRLMPSAADLYETLDAAESFALKRKTRVTLEYVLIAGVNDRTSDAAALSALTEGRPFKINIIPYNEWKGSDFSRPSEIAMERFIKKLLPRAPAVTVRRSQGGDISAACGQLGSSSKGGPPRRPPGIRRGGRQVG